MDGFRTPVDVIALSSASGELRPLRLRLSGDRRIDIEEIV